MRAMCWWPILRTASSGSTSAEATTGTKRKPAVASLHRAPQSRKPPGGGFLLLGRTNYFIAPEAALALLIELMADEAAMPADEAASIADVAADEAAMLAEAAASDVIGDDAIVAGGGRGRGGGRRTCRPSSCKAAKATAAAIVAINRAVLMFLLDLGSYNFQQLWEPSSRGPQHWKARKRVLSPVLSMPSRRL